MPKERDLLELIRRKASMSSQIVTDKDPEYSYYAGASYEIAEKMANVDFFLKSGLIPQEYVPFIKLYRAYLDQKRKAFFASIGCTEITKLGFILGDTRKVVKSTDST